MAVGLDHRKFTLESIDQFARRELPDSLLIELDEHDEFPEALVRLCAVKSSGSSSCSCPSSTARWEATRSTSAACASGWRRSTSVLATFLGSDLISVGGTPEQKRQFMGWTAEEAF